MVNVGECPVTVNRVFSWEHLHHSALCVFFVKKHYWKASIQFWNVLGISPSRLAFVILLVYWACCHVTLLTEKNNRKAQ